MSIPLVSIIMPMYNALPFAKDAIASILGQSFRDFELLIIDNGSTDGSLEYVESISDSRVRVLQERERGAGRALTAGIFAGRGELLAVMDADDVAHPDRIRTEVEFLQAHPDIILVGTRFAFLVGSAIIPVPPQPKEHEAIRRALMEGRPVICNPSTMFRADIAKTLGGHQLPGPGHDVDFFLRMTEVGKVANIPALLHYYRLHAASNSIVKMAEVNRFHGFSIACAKARAKGQDEPDISKFSQDWDRRSLLARLAELADAKSLELYRRAVVMRTRNQHLGSFGASIVAALLSPRRTNWHVKRRFGLC